MYALDARMPTSLRDVYPYVNAPLTYRLVGLGGERYLDRSDPADVTYRYRYPPELEEAQPPDTRQCIFDPLRWSGALNGLDCPDRMIVIRATIAGDPNVEIRGYADGHTGVVTLSAPTAAQQASALAADGGQDLGEAEDDAEFESRLRAVQLRGLEAALEVAQLAGEGDVSLDTLRHDLTSPEATTLAALLLDCDQNGVVTNDDLLMAAEGDKFSSNGTLSPPMAILVDYLRESIVLLELDQPGGESPEIPVEFLGRWAQLEAGQMLSYDSACELTLVYVEHPKTAMGLCAKLVAAAEAESRGQLNVRDNILRAYRNELEAQTGKAIALENALDLETLSWVLQSAGD